MAHAEQTPCGDDQVVCEDAEKCCEHRVATYCEKETCSSVRVEGECIPKENSCGEFWCGNRQCQTSWLITENVCCVYYQPGNTPLHLLGVRAQLPRQSYPPQHPFDRPLSSARRLNRLASFPLFIESLQRHES